MKKAITHPDNISTKFIDPDHYDATHATKFSKRVKDVRDGTYKAYADTTLSHNGSDGLATQFIAGDSRHYYDDIIDGNMQQYDWWRNPLFVQFLRFNGTTGYILQNPSFDNAESAAPRFKRIDGAAHNFRDGQNVFISGSSYLSMANNLHAIVRVIDSTTFDLYRHTSYNQTDGTPDYTHSQTETFRQYELEGRRIVTWQTAYDTRPPTHQSDQSVTEYRLKTERGISEDNNSTTDNNWLNDSTKGFIAPLTVRATGLTGFADDTRFFAHHFSDRWAAYCDKPYTIVNNIPVAGWSNTTNLPTHTRTNDVQIGTGGVGTGLFYKLNHGFVNDDVVNITKVAGGEFTLTDDRKLLKGGCGHAYWVERINDNYFDLHIVPYLVRGGASKIKFNTTTSTDQYQWEHLTAQTIDITTNRCDIFTPSADTSTTFNYPDYNAYRIQTTGTDSYLIKYKNDGSGHDSDLLRDANMQIFASSRDPLPLRVDGNNNYVIFRGNKVYSYTDASGATVKTNAARAKPNFHYTSEGLSDITAAQTPTFNQSYNINVPGSPSPPALVETFSDPVFTTDSNGYITGVTWDDGTGQAGRSNNSTTFNYHRTFIVENKPNETYTGAVAYTEDTFDTADYLATNVSNDNRAWPDHIRPRKATITVAQPGSSHRSQSGIKYVRGSGVVKYQLELDYPAMTQTDFAPFLAMAQAVRGQVRPFNFKLRYPKDTDATQQLGILFQRPDFPDGLLPAYRLLSVDSTDNRVITLGGFESDQVKAVIAGQHIGNLNNRNGGINSIIQDQDANIFGECKFRCAYPVTGATVGDIIELNPEKAIVTLADDNFEYFTDYQGFYQFKVILDLDEFK